MSAKDEKQVIPKGVEKLDEAISNKRRKFHRAIL
jgi:hypothetical protein